MLVASFPRDVARSIVAGDTASAVRPWGPCKGSDGPGWLAVADRSDAVLGVCRVRFTPPHERTDPGAAAGCWLWEFSEARPLGRPEAYGGDLALGLGKVPARLASRWLAGHAVF